MDRQRARRALSTILALLLVFAIVPMTAAAETTEDTATQEVVLDVVEPGVLRIEVDDHINFHEVYWGQISEQHDFHMSYRNTKEVGTTWSATVAATDFVRYEWVHPEGEPEGWEESTDDSFSAAGNLTIYPGLSLDAYEKGVRFGGPTPGDPDVTVTFGDGPLTIMTAPDDFRGQFHPWTWDEGLNEDIYRPWLQVDVPDGQPEGHYRAVLTYTLTG